MDRPKSTGRRLKYKRKRRRRFYQRLLLLVILWSVVLLCFRFVISELRDGKQGNLGASSHAVTSVPDRTPESGAAETDTPSIPLDLHNLYSPCVILKELESGHILAGQNSAEKIYPASLTKIMTAILAIENTENFSDTVTLETELFQTLYLQHASMAGFEPEETVALNDLLYGIILPSGAECCIAYAEYIAGTESDFVGMMNKKADELGMENTHFTNSTGLHDEAHYSTVSDLSVLLEYALQNEVFRKVFTSESHTALPTALHPEGLAFMSTLFETMNDWEPKDPVEYIIGGKTGYTQEAGLCLASLACVNGKEYLLITAHAPGSHNTEPFHILDAQNLYGQIARY